ncbi:hypothetical protein BSKO_11413 [Bryopsis sp. KO-2023]|nr:hypothetical protein BSKO_11413 [Bryopsis sp. KO-2023]
MASVPVKFPRTHHLIDTGAATRDDLVLDRGIAQHMIQSRVICEEKVDGSNLGLSFDENWNLRAQKRGHWVTSVSEAQYAKLDGWIKKHRASLFDVLGQDRILYGEWLCARHTVTYDQLPDWFLAFDIYDKTRKCFLSRSMRDELLKETSIYSVRCVTERAFQSLDEVFQLMLHERSAYAENEPIEGIYIRLENRDGTLLDRAKLVRPDFIQIVNSSMHWSKQNTIGNSLRPDLWDTPLEIYHRQYEQ